MRLVRVGFYQSDELAGDADAVVRWRNVAVAARHAHDNVNVDVAFLGDTRDCEICSPALNVYCAFIDDGSDGVVSKFLDQVCYR